MVPEHPYSRKGASYDEQALVQGALGRPSTSVEINGRSVAVGGLGGRVGGYNVDRRAYRGALPRSDGNDRSLPAIEDDPFGSYTKRKRYTDTDSDSARVPTSYMVEDSPSSSSYSSASSELVGAWEQLGEEARGEPASPPVADFLAGIGMGQYADAFTSNEITMGMLHQLPKSDMSELIFSENGSNFSVECLKYLGAPQNKCNWFWESWSRSLCLKNLNMRGFLVFLK